MNEAEMAAALRKIAGGLADLASALEDSHGDENNRKAAALARFDVRPEHGLSRAQASAALRENGLSPRLSGYWTRSGLIAHEDDRRWLTERGREWLRRHQAADQADHD
jgi:hypothetical protein